MNTLSRRYCLIFCALTLGLSLPGHAQNRAVLTISGTPLSGNPPSVVALNLAQLKALPQVTHTSKTPWYKEPVTFTGPLLRDVLAAAKMQPGLTLKAVALDEYAVTIPWSDAQDFDVVLAHSIDGVALTPRSKGPLFVMYPYDSQPKVLQSVKYYERSIWQLRSLQVQ